MINKFYITAFLISFGYNSYTQNWISVGGGANFPVRELYADTINNQLYAVGQFTDIGSSNANRVALWNGTSWYSLCGQPYLSDPTTIPWVTMYNYELYVSGGQTIMGDSMTGHLAHYAGNSQWEKFADFDGIADLEVMENKLLLYGNFDSIGNQPIRNLAFWDGAVWSPAGDTNEFNTVNVAFIADVELYQSKLIVGGNINSTQYKEVLEWDGIAWAPLGNGIPGGSAWINCMKEYQGILYIGGYFNEPGFPAFLVAWNGQNYFKPFPDVDFLGQVWDLEVINNELYILGPVQIDIPYKTYGFTKFDGDTLCVFGGSGVWGTPYDSPWASSITEFNGDLYVTANKTMLYDTVNYIAKWNGSEMDTCIYSPLQLGYTTLTNPVDKINIFPNPTSSLLSVSGIVEMEFQVLKLCDTQGKILFETVDFGQLKNIDVSVFSAGNYLLSIETKSGFTIWKRCIKE